MRQWVVFALASALMSAALAADRGVVIQAYTPTEAAGLDWAPEDVDTLDELWNDCYLAYELFCSRPGMDTNLGNAHIRLVPLSRFPVSSA
uniref:Uncharacterized protein n=1 Tax=candidate division WOR-3 bacterium TaxID=2052148 RepID=A0A7C4GB49_UNCW3